MELPLAAAIIATASDVTTVASAVAAGKEDNQDNYPSAAAAAEKTVVSVTHITTPFFQFSIPSYAAAFILLLWEGCASEKIFSKK